jgi:rapamycin-insensitive companion of mTOR
MNGQAINTSPIPKGEVIGGQSTTASATPLLQQQSVSESPVVMTDGMIRALVSAAENADDSMQAVCLEALMEIGKSSAARKSDLEAVIDISRLLNSSALRVLLMCYKDGPAELCPAMTHILMYLANSPATRQHLLPQADVEVRFTSGFS